MNTSIKGNPGAQGHCSFGTTYRTETSNVKGGKLPLKQTVASPKPAPSKSNKSR